MRNAISAKILATASLCVAVHAAQIPAAWTGGAGSDLYSSPGNWDIGVVPLNNGVDTFVVTIPAGFAVVYDGGPAGVVDELTLGQDAELSFTTGNFLQVLGAASLDGPISADGPIAFLTAAGAGATLGGHAQLFVSGGAGVTVAANAYAYDGGLLARTIISAAGFGSTLNLSSLSAINTTPINGPGAATWTFLASDQGEINLSGVTSITGPLGSSDVYRFRTASGGVIDLSGVATIDGNVWLDIGTAGMAMPALTAMIGEDLRISVRTGASLSIPQVSTLTDAVVELEPNTVLTATLAEIDGSSVLIDSGAGVTISDTDYVFTRGGTGATLFQADGANAVLDLSSLATLEGAPADLPGAATLTVDAVNGGFIDLPNITTATGGPFNDVLRYRAAFGGDINLDALASITGNVRLESRSLGWVLPALASITGEGNRITIGQNSSLSLPLIATLTDAVVDIEPNSVLNAALTEIDGTRVFVDSNATLSITDTSYTYTAGGLSTTIFEADGPGALLDLTSLAALNPSPTNLPGAATLTVQAINGGLIDLPNIATADGGPFSNDRLRFRAAFGGDINLDGLTATTGRIWLDSQTTGWMLPALSSITGEQNRITVGDASSLSIPLVSSLLDAEIDIGENAVLDLNLTAFDGTTVLVGAGSQYAINAASYAFDRLVTGRTILEADGVGALLDLSTLTSISGPTGNAPGAARFTIAGTNGGVIDLSNVSDIAGSPIAGSGDRFRVLVNAGGDVRLDALATAGPGMWFDIDAAAYALPALTTLSGGAHIIEVRPNTTLSMPLINSINDAVITIEPNAVFNATLTNFDDSRIHVSGGSQFAVAASAYSYQLAGLSQTLFSADGAGSRLDFSTVRTYTGPSANGSGAAAWTMLAGNGGEVDMSGLRTLVGAAGFSDVMGFRAESGGLVTLGAATMSRSLRFSADGPASVVDVGGGLRMGDAGGLMLTNDGLVVCAGDVFYNTTDETRFDAEGGTLQMHGAGPHRLEIAGEDLGANGSSAGNFGIGQLIVGSDTDTTLVGVVDCIDNGNRGANVAEALYLYGIAGGDGLRILNGSTLVLAEFNVYANIGGVMTDLQALIPGGLDTIAFDQGFLSLVGTITPGDVDGDGDVDLTDLAVLLANFGVTSGASRSDGDFDGDEDVDLADLAVLLANFGRVCA